MIEINLLPQELKLKTKKEPGGLEKMQILYFIPLSFAILIIMHICLAGPLVIKQFQLNLLNNRWQKFAHQRKAVDDFRKEFTLSTDEDRIMQQLTNQRINWSEKLNKLSLHLPNGIWFYEIAINPRSLTLKATVVSLQKQEMSLISRFMGNLKSDANFFKDFNNLELSSVQRRVIGTYDILDFILTGNLKTK